MSLRWYYPDQVDGRRQRTPPSQPGYLQAPVDYVVATFNRNIE